MHLFWNYSNLKPPVARKLAVRHSSVPQLVFWLLVVSWCFHQIISQNSMIFPWLFRGFFSISMIFPGMELFLVISRFSMISSTCGNPVLHGLLYNLRGYRLDEELGDICIKNFHLGRYILGYTVRHLVLRHHKTWFPNIYPTIYLPKWKFWIWLSPF